MKSKSTLLNALIAVLPLIVLLFTYNNLPDLVHTKITGSGAAGALISKQSFGFILAVLSVAFYYVSFLLSSQLVMLYPYIRQSYLWVLLNLLLASLSISLIVVNL